jgi:hypothetical protein
VLLSAIACRRSPPPAEARQEGPERPAAPKQAPAPPAAAPSAHASADASTGSARSARPWGEQLRALAGAQPVFLARDKAGQLVGRTPDGKVQLPLLPKAPGEVVIDGPSELAWVRSGAGLDVMDLRTPAPALIPIARQMPAGVAWRVAQGPGKPDVGSDGLCEVDQLVTLHWHTDFKLEVEGARARPKVVGKQWLSANEERERGPTPSHWALTVGKNRVKVELPATVRRCGMRDYLCGSSLPFGSAGWKLVLVEMAEKDRCRSYKCLLHDPKTKAFASPTNPTKWSKAEDATPGQCGVFQLDASRSWYLIGDKVCSATGAGCRELGGDSLGWLPPALSIGPEGGPEDVPK